jgi:hypothetical protein
MFETKWVQTTSIPLVSMRQDTGPSGNYLLGCGTIGTEAYYWYYIKAANGGYALRKFNADQVTIHEHDSTGGLLIRRDKEFVNPDHGWFGKTGRFSWEFHIPAGSIQQDFRI